MTSIAFGHGMSDAEKQLIIDGGNLKFIWIGATHMLSGYDHLAFIFGIIFFLTRFKDIVKYISVFTVGHSMTLILATFTALQINYFLIDAVIALSVCYIAFHNIDGFKKYLNIKAPNMMVMIFSLGLIHGLGLSTRLQQLPLNADSLLMNIVSFNLGIEFGQILALAVMLLVISLFRKSVSFPKFSKIANYILIFAGLFLFLMQMHGYEHWAATNATPELKQEAVSEDDIWADTIEITIPANSDKEYKIQVLEGDVFLYEWEADNGKLFFDFHGEPKGDTSGYFKSFKVDTLSIDSGELTTIFAGTHGWYWRNSNLDPVIITLKLSGKYQLLD